MADTDDDVKRVAIIGAGLSGLLSLYHLKTSRTKIELTAFEKNFDIGGTWLYTDQTKPNDFGLPVYTGLYKYLRFFLILFQFCFSCCCFLFLFVCFVLLFYYFGEWVCFLLFYFIFVFSFWFGTPVLTE